MHNYSCWFDGAYTWQGKWNPYGSAVAGAVIRAEHGDLLNTTKHVGSGSCNVAEFGAVSLVLERLLTLPVGQAVVKGDSKIVLNSLRKSKPAKGICHDASIKAITLLSCLLTQGWKVDLCWVPRGLNTECDALSKSLFPLTH